MLSLLSVDIKTYPKRSPKSLMQLGDRYQENRNGKYSTLPLCNEARFHCGLHQETHLHSCTKAFCRKIHTSIGICIKQLMILQVWSVAEHRSCFPLEQSYLLWITTSSLRGLAAPWRGRSPPQLPLAACSCPWTPKLPSSMRPRGPCDQPVPSVKQRFLGLKLRNTHRGLCYMQTLVGRSWVGLSFCFSSMF